MLPHEILPGYRVLFLFLNLFSVCPMIYMTSMQIFTNRVFKQKFFIRVI